MRLYVDTNIFLNHFKDEKGPSGKPFGKIAWKFFFEVVSRKEMIIVSSWTTRELFSKISGSAVEALFAMLKDRWEPINETEEDREKANALWPEHPQDALHVVLAQKSNADFLVTRNMKDFRQFSHLIVPKLPEQVFL